MNPFLRVLSGPEDQLRAPFEDQLQRFSRCRLVGLWRSPLQETIRRSGPGRAPSNEWQRLIANTVNAGVSGDEISLSGILGMLEWDDPQRLVERGEILDYLDEVGLKIQVLQERGWTMGRPWFFLAPEEHPERFQTTLRQDSPHNSRFGIQVERAGLFDSPEHEGRWVARFRRPGEAEIHTVCTAEDALMAGQWCHGVAWRAGNIGCGPLGRFGLAALTGGTNYRELLFVIPDALPAFKDSHFPVDNVLCHLRLVDRITEDGACLLHIEEIQSDWHKPRHNYPGPPLKKQWLKIALGWCVQEARERGLDGVSLSSGEIQYNRSINGGSPGLKKFYARVEKALESVAAGAGGVRSTAVYNCREKMQIRIMPVSARAKNKDRTWCLIGARDRLLLGGIKTAREASEIRRKMLSQGPVKLPAVRLCSAPKKGWTTAFFRLDADATGTLPAATEINARGRAALELIDRLENHVCNALVLLGCRDFPAIASAMNQIREELANQDYLPADILVDLRNFADNVAVKKSQRQQAGQLSAALGWLRNTLVVLRNAIRQTGDLPSNWHELRALMTAALPAAPAGIPGAQQRLPLESREMDQNETGTTAQMC